MVRTTCWKNIHPRCRSTISAIVEGGKRTAKVNGKNIKVPAEMKYKDFKAVYLEKKVSLEAWKSSLEGGKRIAKVAGRNVKIPADWNYEKWRASIEMYRKAAPSTQYKAVSEEKYQQLIIPLKKMGVTIMRDADAERHLDFVKARASTLGAEAVLFRKDVTMSEILEETHHVKQNRAGLNDDKDVRLRTILNEIDAKEYLLKAAKKYGIPREEIEDTKIQLEEYKKALEDYMKG